MKKSLIALAVVAASGAAMAQSSVTLYGVADAGIGKQKYGSGGAAPANDSSNKVEFLSGALMNNGNSRIGVRGVEDLGGGLKAGFNFESGLDLDDGGSLGSGGGFWGRAANLWLGGGWGTVKLGRTLNPSFYGMAAWELTGAANYSVVANTFGFSGNPTPRHNSQFSYKTPDLGGFSAELGYIFKPDNAGNARWDVNAIYANGPIGVGLAAHKQKNGKLGYGAGLKWSFSNFALAASYNDKEKVRRGFSLGGSANFGAFTLTADVTRDTRNQLGKKYTNFLLEGKYALSKRTFVYLAGLRLDSTNNYGLGIRHNF